MNTEKPSGSHEIETNVFNGWIMLPTIIGTFLGMAALIIYALAHGMETDRHPIWILLAVGLVGELTSFLFFFGFFTLQPNEARVLILFGGYRGTVRRSGFHWGNPFYANGMKMTRLEDAGGTGRSGHSPQVASVQCGRNKISLRARTLTVEKLKVNDKRGNPIEIAAVVVWRVQDTAQATFDVDNYEGYVHTQSETALRHLASSYSYDDAEGNEATLRGNVDEISKALREELQQRLAKAGVAVDEARLTNLSYAPEIAQTMLRRQQAEAVIAARQKIVAGAVSMVEMALHELAAKRVVELDDERKAAMVSNLLVVLCSESQATPVVNAGTLYS